MAANDDPVGVVALGGINEGGHGVLVADLRARQRAQYLVVAFEQ